MPLIISSIIVSLVQVGMLFSKKLKKMFMFFPVLINLLIVIVSFSYTNSTLVSSTTTRSAPNFAYFLLDAVVPIILLVATLIIATIYTFKKEKSK